MADPNNPGQFGNRDDTAQQASKGGRTQDSDNNMQMPDEVDNIDSDNI